MRFYLAVATLVFSLLSSYQAAYAQTPPSVQSMSRSITADRTSNQIISGVSDSIASRMIKLTLSVEKTAGQMEGLIYQLDNVLLQKFDNNSLLVWDFARSAQIAEYKLESSTNPVHYDTSSGRLLVLRNGVLSSRIQAKKGAAISESIFLDSVSSAAVSKDKKSVFVGFSDGSVGKFTSAGTQVWRQKPFKAPVRQIAVDWDGKRVSAISDENVAKTIGDNGKVSNSYDNVKRIGQFNAKGMQALLLQTGQLVKVGLTGAVTVQAPKTDVRSFSLNHSGSSMLVLSDSGQLSIGLDNQWKLVDAKIKDAFFVSDKRYIVARDDGVVHLKQMDLDHYLVAIVPGASGWVIVDHEGRYDGTIEGGKDVKWAGEGATLNLDQFFKNYYQPGLLAAYVNGDEGQVLQAVPANTGEGVFPPAKMDIQFPEGKMKSGQLTKVVAIAESKGGELPEDIRLFHNGKRLPEKARLGSQRVQQNEKILVVQVFAFTPEAGVNEVFAEIRNAHGVGSRSEIQREVTEGFRAPGRMYVLGTGVDKYKTPGINLDFAATDVQAVVKRLTAGDHSIHKEAIPKLVLDSRATKREILDQLAQLEKLGADDSVILVFAGHGEEQKGEWYFLPHDVDLKRLSATAVSAREIQDALVAAPPKRIFLMVDACNSGATIDTFNRFRAFQRRFVQQVGRDSGVTVLTATRRNQLAAELPELGHGIFTHVILQGLDGRAAANTSNGQVSAHQLANYVGANLEKLAQPYFAGEGLSQTQTPAYFVIGSDFLISDTAVSAK
jgi:hypothetical protein